jgi:hypothetical protein
MAAVFTLADPSGLVGKIRSYDVTVTSHTDGTGTSDYIISGIRGALWQVVTDPTDGPTDNWDVYIEDENGVDLLGAAGENRDTTNSEICYPVTSDNSKPMVDGSLRVRVAGMGSGKTAVVRVFIYFR